MWICLNNAFVSIVEDYFDSTQVYVRGRREEDVRNFLGDYLTPITQTDDRDYRFRAFVPKFDLSKILAKCADRIDYGNFKSSVHDKQLSNTYTEFWISGIANLDPGWSERQEVYYQKEDFDTISSD